MLKYKADIQSIFCMILTTAILAVHWYLGLSWAWSPILFFAACYMAVLVSVMSHNHNHLPMWKSDIMNKLTEYWLTIFYGYPTFGWVPTHNMNHHKFNNKDGDFTLTYRYSENNNLFTLVTYPFVSMYFQMREIFPFVIRLWNKKRGKSLYYFSQYLVLYGFLGAAFAFALTGKAADNGILLAILKVVLLIMIPQFVSTYVVMIFNYVQHVHTDEKSKLNHSRNIVGKVWNLIMFNNGLHTIHHERPGVHWSEARRLHKEIEGNIDPVLNERSFFWYIFRNYFLGMFIPKFRTTSMRLKRQEAERHVQQA